ncbi:MAG TPA: substrate-binding domain-containing protein [Blastococcus sp.]|nr:substrate-binding domain-containing protein [Blastococcus sp.]
MRTSRLSLAAVGAVAALTVAACGSSNSGGSSASGSSASGSSGAGNVSAVCKSPSTISGSSAASGSGLSGLKATGKVGVILPDTTSSTRYTLYDAPLLTSAFKAAGLTPDVQNSGGSTAKQQQIAQSMIGEGVKVLLLDSIDQTSGAAIEQQAKQAGIKVVDYDRVNIGGSAAYYVSFDNEGVGKLQGQTLADCLAASGKSNPKVIEMDGGTDVDNNAVLFAKGANSVLKPLADQKKLTIASESVVKGWKVENAAPAFTQALTAAGGQVDGVLAANDDIANAVIGVLQQQGLAGHVVVTGQDAGVEGLQNILKGTQSMTIFKNVKTEANAAAGLAIALIAGKDPASAGVTLTSGIDPKNPGLKSLLLTPQVITQSNVQDVVTAGALTAAQICKGIEQQCSAAGVK